MPRSGESEVKSLETSLISELNFEMFEKFSCPLAPNLLKDCSKSMTKVPSSLESSVGQLNLPTLRSKQLSKGEKPWQTLQNASLGSS